MFLDDKLRDLAAQKKALALRQELGRQLARLEWRLGFDALRRPLDEAGLGLALIKRLLGARRRP